MRNERLAGIWRVMWRAAVCLAAVPAVSFAVMTALALIREGAGLPDAAGIALRQGLLPLIRGGFGAGAESLRAVIAEAGVLMLMALSIALCLRAGLLNVGAPGQYAVGVCAAWMCAAVWELPWFVSVAASAAAGALAGALFGWMRRRSGSAAADVLLDALILCAVYAVIQRVSAQTAGGGAIPEARQIPALGKGADGYLARPVTWGVLAALIGPLVLWTVEKFHIWGYGMRLMGASGPAAEYAGVNRKRMTVLCMTLSGLLAGLGGGSGALSGMAQGISAAEAGLDGLGVALLAGGHPLGVLLSSAAAAHLRGGCRRMGAPYDGGLAAWLICGGLMPLCGWTLRVWRMKAERRLRGKKEEAP